MLRVAARDQEAHLDYRRVDGGGVDHGRVDRRVVDRGVLAVRVRKPPRQTPHPCAPRRQKPVKLEQHPPRHEQQGLERMDLLGKIEAGLEAGGRLEPGPGIRCPAERPNPAARRAPGRAGGRGRHAGAARALPQSRSPGPRGARARARKARGPRGAGRVGAPLVGARYPR